MLYSLMSGLYSYLFPETTKPLPKETKESVEHDLLVDRASIVLKTFDDEKEAIKLAKQKHMEVEKFKDTFMYQCASCYKHRFPQNISFIFKDLKTNFENDPNNDMYFTCCKDDEGCIIETRDFVRKFL